MDPQRVGIPFENSFSQVGRLDRQWVSNSWHAEPCSLFSFSWHAEFVDLCIVVLCARSSFVDPNCLVCSIARGDWLIVVSLRESIPHSGFRELSVRSEFCQINSRKSLCCDWLLHVAVRHQSRDSLFDSWDKFYSWVTRCLSVCLSVCQPVACPFAQLWVPLGFRVSSSKQWPALQEWCVRQVLSIFCCLSTVSAQQ